MSSCMPPHRSQEQSLLRPDQSPESFPGWNTFLGWARVVNLARFWRTAPNRYVHFDLPAEAIRPPPAKASQQASYPHAGSRLVRSFARLLSRTPYETPTEIRRDYSSSGSAALGDNRRGRGQIQGALQ